MNTEVDGCEDEACATLTPFGQSGRSDPPNHPRREFGLNRYLPPRPILSLLDTEHRQNAHHPHPQYRVRDPFPRTVSSSEPKRHARREGVAVFDGPIFSEVPFWAEGIGVRVLALFMMNLPRSLVSAANEPTSIANQIFGKIIVPVTRRQDETSSIKSHAAHLLE